MAGVPFYARWPYEVHIWSRRHIGALSDFTPQEDRELAAMMRVSPAATTAYPASSRRSRI